MQQTLQPNTLLQGGKYRIIEPLGQGGFGITYLGEQTSLGRMVAIKEFFMKDLCNRDEATSHVSVGSEGSREMVNRFRMKFVKEAKSIARLEHPNIVRVIDIFEENGTAYYVMEYCEGGSLSAKLRQQYHTGMPGELALKYIRQIASALDYIHQLKINHLDVKPANIMLNKRSDAVLIDFGLAKQYDAETGNQTSSTPVGISEGYAPIEQYKKGGVGTFSAATDIYALSATLYKLVTGLTPPSADDVFNEGLPTLSSSVPANIVKAIAQGMQPRKLDRPQSIGAWMKLLDEETVIVDNEDEETTHIDLEQEKAEQERLRKEAERKAAREKAEEEARKKAAKEKAEAEARAKAAKEKAETEARKKAAQKKAETEARRKDVEQSTLHIPESKGNTKKILVIAIATIVIVAIAWFVKPNKDEVPDLEVQNNDIGQIEYIDIPTVCSDNQILYGARKEICPVPQSFGSTKIVSNQIANGIGTIEFDTTLIEMGVNTFQGMKDLTNITLPKGLKEIRARVFQDCSNLVTVTLPPNVERIGENAFWGCEKLEIINLPNTLTEIDECAFHSCKSLKCITIPEKTFWLKSYCFCNCKSLTNVTLPEGLTSISYEAFAGCENLNELTIPQSVWYIHDKAFRDCKKLSSINIPSNIKEICNYTFAGCESLSSITIPKNVESIAKNAFEGCNSLTSIQVEKGNRVYDSRNNCNAIIETKTNTLLLACQNTVIPKNITTIGHKAFGCCKNMTSITIPESVKSLAADAFSGCGKLEKIILGSVPPAPIWERIGIGERLAIPQGTKVYIPKGSLSTYKQAVGWTNIPNQFIEY